MGVTACLSTAWQGTVVEACRRCYASRRPDPLAIPRAGRRPFTARFGRYFGGHRLDGPRLAIRSAAGKQARLHTETLNQITLASAALQRAEQDKRLTLEQQLAAKDQTHYRALTDAQRDQDRLRDRLATADVRLSVLLDATDSTNGCAVPATTSAGGVVHGATRARLDPAHAQRIIGITDVGDRG